MNKIILGKSLARFSVCEPVHDFDFLLLELIICSIFPSRVAIIFYCVLAPKRSSP